MQKKLGISSKNPYVIQVIAFVTISILLVILSPFAATWILQNTTGGQTWFVACFAIGLAVFWLLVTLFLIALGHGHISDVEKMLAGEHWAHWRYTSDEWELARAQEVQRTKLTLRIAGIISILVGAFTGWFFRYTIEIAILSGLAAAIVVFLIAGSSQLMRLWRYAEARQNPEAYVNAEGIYLAGSYNLIRDTNMQLASVQIEPGEPQNMLFKSKRRVASKTGSTVVDEEMRVPIPKDRLIEAELLVERFRIEVLQE